MQRKQEYDYLFKFQVIGDPKSGKSSLILRYADNTFTDDPISTIGVDFKNRILDLQHKTIKTQVWDSRGRQDEISNGAHAIIFAVDLTNESSMVNLQKWLQCVDRYAPRNVKKVLVVTKSDLPLPPMIDLQVLKEDLKEFAEQCNLLGPIFTSAKHGTNIEEPFVIACESILQSLEQEKEEDKSVPAPKKKEKERSVIIPIPTLQEKKELLAQIKKIVENDAWCEATRFKKNKYDTIKPDGIKQIENILNNNKLTEDEKLLRVASCASYKQSESFQWVHNLFRGRDEKTNQFYQLLGQLNGNLGNSVVMGNIKESLKNEFSDINNGKSLEI